jgi:hypothetical protein
MNFCPEIMNMRTTDFLVFKFIYSGILAFKYEPSATC